MQISAVHDKGKSRQIVKKLKAQAMETFAYEYLWRLKGSNTIL